MDCLLKFAKIKNANLSPHFIIMEYYKWKKDLNGNVWLQKYVVDGILIDCIKS